MDVTTELAVEGLAVQRMSSACGGGDSGDQGQAAEHYAFVPGGCSADALYQVLGYWAPRPALKYPAAGLGHGLGP